MHFYVYYLILFIANNFVGAINKLPSFIKVCHRGDPNISDCLKSHANEAIPHMLSGLKEYNIPSLSPFKINELDVGFGENFKFHLTNITILGTETCEFLEGTLNIDKPNFVIVLFFNKLQLTATYEADGRILVLPIQGKGPIELVIGDVKCNVVVHLEWLDKDGERYIYINDIDIVLDEKSSMVRLDNLFNGDKFLGDQMNKFLNDNWKDVRSEVIPAIKKVIESIAKQILNSFLNDIPFDNIFPE